MTDQELEQLTIQVTKEQKQQIEQIAHERGFQSADEYVLALVAQVVEDETYEDDIDPEESFRRGWHEAMSGKTRSIDDVWNELDDE